MWDSLTIILEIVILDEALNSLLNLSRGILHDIRTSIKHQILNIKIKL